MLPAHLDKFELYEDILYYVREARDGTLNFTLVVPEALVNKALELSHTEAGHFGQFKSIKRTEAHFYFPNLRTKMTKFIKTCCSCQQFKAGTTLGHYYQELPPVTRPLERIAIDLTDMTSGRDGYRYILTVIDHFSRFVKFFPLRTKQAGGIISHLERYVADFGCPLT